MEKLTPLYGQVGLNTYYGPIRFDINYRQDRISSNNNCAQCRQNTSVCLYDGTGGNWSDIISHLLSV